MNTIDQLAMTSPASVACIMPSQAPALHALTDEELEAVSGGFFPLAILAFSIGFDAGFIGYQLLRDDL